MSLKKLGKGHRLEKTEGKDLLRESRKKVTTDSENAL
jgi:hypothetical protein